MLQRARTKKSIRRASRFLSSLPDPTTESEPEPDQDVKMDEEKMSGVTIDGDTSEYHSLPVEKISSSIMGEESSDFRSMTTSVTPSNVPRENVPVMNGFELDDVPTAIPTQNNPRVELSKWNGGLDKIQIIKLSTEQVASAMAAHLVNYEEEQLARFASLKGALTSRFREKHIFGRSIAFANEFARTAFLISAMTAIATVVDDEAVMFLKPLVQEFIRVVSKLDSVAGK